MNLTKQLRNEKLFLQNKLKKIDCYLHTHNPDGKLRCIKNHGTYQYYINNKYIDKKSRERAKEIATYNYYTKLKKIIACRIINLNNLIDSYVNSDLDRPYKALSKGRQQLIVPEFIPIDEKITQFKNITYPQKDITNSTTFITHLNEQVRSKSEVLISNELAKFNIPYHYELPVTLTHHSKEITLHPDFTVINPSTGELWLWEHLGMMDNLEYYNNSLRKITIYEENNYLLGKNLIISHETSVTPINISTVRKYITEYLL